MKKIIRLFGFMGSFFRDFRHFCRAVNERAERVDAAIARALKRAQTPPNLNYRPKFESLEELVMPTTYFFSRSVNFVRESVGQVVVPVIRDDASSSGSIDYATSDGTASSYGESTNDYNAASGTLSFAEGQTVADITLTVHNYTNSTGYKYFSISLLDGEETVATSTVTIAEKDWGSGPVAPDSSFVSLYSATVYGGAEQDNPGLLDNAYVPGEGSATITGVYLGQSSGAVDDDLILPSGATLNVQSDGSFSYIPAAGFDGIDSFAITFTDGTTTGKAIVYVNAISDQMLIPDQTYDVLDSNGQILHANVLDDATDAGGNTLTITQFTYNEENFNPGDSVYPTLQLWTLEIDSDGSLTFQRNDDNNFAGTLFFTFDVSNGLTTTTGSAWITVAPPWSNGSGTDTLAWDGTYAALSNNTFNAGDGTDNPGLLSLAYVPGVDTPAIDHITVGETNYYFDENGQLEATMPSGATLTVQSNGNFSYEPATDFVDSESFTFWVTNGSTTASAEVTIEVYSLDPIAIGPSYFAVKNTGFSAGGEEEPAGLLQNAFDPTNHSLTVSLVNGLPHDYESYNYTSQGGIISFENDGSFTYAPPSNFTGVDTFTFTIDNGNGGTAIATARLQVFETVGSEQPDAVNEKEALIEQQQVNGQRLTENLGRLPLRINALNAQLQVARSTDLPAALAIEDFEGRREAVANVLLNLGSPLGNLQSLAIQIQSDADLAASEGSITVARRNAISIELRDDLDAVIRQFQRLMRQIRRNSDRGFLPNWRQTVGDIQAIRTDFDRFSQRPN